MVDGGAVWIGAGHHASAIEAALREMLKEQFQQDEAYAPARVLNLVVIVDREWRGEIMNRLEQVGRYHASRTILCAVEEGRETIDARAAITPAHEHRPGELTLTRERIVLDIGPHHLARLDTIVDPLVVSDIATLVWSPHGHADAVDALLGLAQVVLIDSVGEPDPAAAVRRARELAKQAYLVDLAWLRGTPWRERVATTFDPPQWRPELGRIDSVRVRHRPDSGAAGVLFCGWLASRLGWEAGSLMQANGTLHGKAHGKRQDVTLELVPARGSERPRARGHRDLHRVGDEHLARPRPRRAGGAARRPEGPRVDLDGARCLARRGRHPRGGHPPGVAPRPRIRACARLRGVDAGMTLQPEFEISDDPAAAACELLVGSGGHVVVTGGSTPRAAYERAAERRTDWAGVEFWFTDERCVPPDHEHSNYRMVERALFSKIERATVHRMQGELGPHDGAAAYERELEEAGPDAFDLMLLGLGPDAHICSLFPGDDALGERERKVVGVETAGMAPLVPQGSRLRFRW